MIRISRLDHIVLRARDLETLQSFYVGVVGCTVERVVSDLGLVQLRAGESLIDLVAATGPLGRRVPEPPSQAAPNVDHFCIRIDPFDPDALSGWLAENDVDFEPPQTRYGADGFGPSIYLEDPEGNVVELKGPPSKPPLSTA